MNVKISRDVVRILGDQRLPGFLISDIHFMNPSEWKCEPEHTFYPVALDAAQKKIEWYIKFMLTSSTTGKSIPRKFTLGAFVKWYGAVLKKHEQRLIALQPAAVSQGTVVRILRKVLLPNAS